MNSFGGFAALIGGVGLFLLGMGLMTEGLKVAAGSALERTLAASTKTRVRGLASGALITALVQSSSAVTVATIGFVNAGLLNLSQALWVLFGANVGTTMTGWLVALVGLKFDIEALALPLIGAGMFLRLTGERSHRSALGMALAGFGVLFLGIDLLGDTFSGLAPGFDLPTGETASEILLLVLIGTVLTVLMQSSSAALAVALTAAQGGLLEAQGAAAVVIGANIGTTVTAVIAAVGATPNARRAAAAHIVFNLLTGVLALLLLPWLIGALSAATRWLGVEATPAASLASFHTVFNVLGVVLMWPAANRLTSLLEARFRNAAEDEAQVRYIDDTVLAVPAVALDAVAHEIRHMGTIALRAASTALGGPPDNAARVHDDRLTATRLNRSIADFVAKLNRAGMSPASAQRMPELLRVARYYEAVADLAVEAVDAARDLGRNTRDAHSAARTVFVTAAAKLLAIADPAVIAAGDERTAQLSDAEAAYQTLKAVLLEDGARGRLAVDEMDARLREASALRRALVQAAKAARMLETIGTAGIGLGAEPGMDP